VSFKTVIETVKLTAVPGTSVSDYEPLLCRILTMYLVIVEPPFAGATQVIVTSVPEIEVVGAAGAEGTV